MVVIVMIVVIVIIQIILLIILIILLTLLHDILNKSLMIYYTKNKNSAKQAFALAYTDVKSAFEYYLKEYNPINPSTGKRRRWNCSEGVPMGCKEPPVVQPESGDRF